MEFKAKVQENEARMSIKAKSIGKQSEQGSSDICLAHELEKSRIRKAQPHFKRGLTDAQLPGGVAFLPEHSHLTFHAPSRTLPSGPAPLALP